MFLLHCLIYKVQTAHSQRSFSIPHSVGLVKHFFQLLLPFHSSEWFQPGSLKRCHPQLFASANFYILPRRHPLVKNFFELLSIFFASALKLPPCVRRSVNIPNPFSFVNTFFQIFQAFFVPDFQPQHIVFGTFPQPQFFRLFHRTLPVTHHKPAAPHPQTQLGARPKKFRQAAAAARHTTKTDRLRPPDAPAWAKRLSPATSDTSHRQETSPSTRKDVPRLAVMVKKGSSARVATAGPSTPAVTPAKRTGPAATNIAHALPLRPFEPLHPSLYIYMVGRTAGPLPFPARPKTRPRDLPQA